MVIKGRNIDLDGVPRPQRVNNAVIVGDNVAEPPNCMPRHLIFFHELLAQSTGQFANLETGMSNMSKKASLSTNDWPSIAKSAMRRSMLLQWTQIWRRTSRSLSFIQQHPIAKV